MKPMLVALKIAAIPMIAVTYVAAMGLTGTCTTCESMVDWTLGRSASAADAAGNDDEFMATDPVSPEAGTRKADPTSSPPTATVDPASLGPVFQLNLPDLAGGSVALAEYAGRPMLIEVWATWCGPCRRLRNVLTDAAPKLAEQGTLVAVSVDKGGAAAVTRHLGDRATPFVELLATPEFRRALAPHNPGDRKSVV